jgi:Tol biopolymer transport system component
MRARFTLVAMLVFLLFAAVLIQAQSGADPTPRCVQIGRGPAGPLAEIECREDALGKTAASSPQIAPMLFWLAEAYNRLENEAKAQEHYRRIVADYCTVAPDLCQKAKIRLDGLRGKGPLEVPTPFTTDLFSFAISPEGKRLVFLATVNGKRALWLQHLDSGKKPEAIPGTEKFRLSVSTSTQPNPFWSPDGKSIGFFSDTKLLRIDVDGGNLKPLADVFPTNCGGSWAGDVILYVPCTLNHAVYRVPAGGGASIRVTPSGAGSHLYPQFLPDGKHFLFSAANEGQLESPLEIRSLDGAEHKALGVSAQAFRFAPPDQLLFLSDGILYAQRLDPKTLTLTGKQVRLTGGVATTKGAVFRNGAISVAATSGAIAYRTESLPRTQLMWRDRQGQPLGTVGQPSLSAFSPRVSPDGKRVALFDVAAARLLELENSDNDRYQPIDLNPLGSRGRGAIWIGNAPPVWAPDGYSLAFSYNNAKGRFDVYRVSTVSNGPSVETLVAMRGQHTTPQDWSRDGVLLHSGTDNRWNRSLFALPANGGEPILVAEDTFWGRFSPDGKWIAYETDGEVFVQPYPGSVSARRRVSSGRSPEWNRNSPEIHFISSDNRLMTASVKFPGAASEGIEFSEPRALFKLPDGATYAPGPDGERFLVLALTDPPPPIFVLSNWTRSTGTAPVASATLPAGNPAGVNGGAAPAPRGALYTNAAQPRQMVVYDRQGKLLARVGDPWPGVDPGSLSMSPDGARIATIKGGALTVIDIASNTMTHLATHAVEAPAWSPDGSKIAYVSNEFASNGGLFFLSITASNREGTEEILPALGNLNVWNWSLDGRFIGIGTDGQFFAIPSSGRAATIVPASGKSNMRLSPDSGFVAYASNEVGGVNQIFVRRFDPDDPKDNYSRQITDNGTGGMIRWRSDGKELYHIAPDGGVMAIPIETEPRIKERTPVELFRVPTGFPVQSGRSGAIADVSADGERFVFLLPLDHEPPQQLEKSPAKTTPVPRGGLPSIRIIPIRGLAGEAVAQRFAFPLPIEADFPSIASYRDLAGESFTMPLVGSTSGKVSGDGVYTDNSPPATAAVHAGILSAGEFGWVRIVLLPGQASYPGTVRNGVTSEASGPGEGSFRIERAPAPYVVQLPLGKDASRLVDFQTLRGRPDATFVIQVVGAARGPLYGSDVYTDDSAIGVAAVHAGLLKDKEVGFVRVIPMPGRDRYTASTNNGVQSRPYDVWVGSYRLEAVGR